MTKHEAVEILEEVRTLEDSMFAYSQAYNDALDMAIDALKAQEPPSNTSISSAIECLLHPQDADDSDMAKAIDTAVRAMRLLKEREPIEPKREIRGCGFRWFCGNCGVSIEPNHMYCRICGKAVKWE